MEENGGETSKKPEEEDDQDNDWPGDGGNALVIVRDYNSP